MPPWCKRPSVSPKILSCADTWDWHSVGSESSLWLASQQGRFFNYLDVPRVVIGLLWRKKPTSEVDLPTCIWLAIIIIMCVKFYLPVSPRGWGLAKGCFTGCEFSSSPAPSHGGSPPWGLLLCVATPARHTRARTAASLSLGAHPRQLMVLGRQAGQVYSEDLIFAEKHGRGGKVNLERGARLYPEHRAWLTGTSVHLSCGIANTPSGGGWKQGRS